MRKFKSSMPYSVTDVISAKLNVDSEFLSLVNDIKSRIEKGPITSNDITRESKLFYAYLEKDIDTMHQFMIIVKQTVSSPRQGKKVLFAITPVIRYGELCLEKYFLAKGDGILDKYFKEFFDQPIVLPDDAFASFIEDQCKMDYGVKSKSSPKYWKRPENSHEILKKFEDLGKINFNVLRKSK